MLLIAGCGADPTPSGVATLEPPFEVVAQSADGHQNHLIVRDEAGLVTDVVPQAPDDQGLPVSDVLVSFPDADHTVLELAWLSTPCRAATMVTLSPNDGRFTLALERARLDPDPGVECEPIGIVYRVTLELEAPILLSDISVESDLHSP